ncbi:MAG: HIT family protein [Nanoarchaeota archaeon]
MACEICEKIKSTNKVYEDNIIACYLSEKSVAPGHLIIAPKKHYTIFEHIPKDVLSGIFSLANTMSLVFVQELKTGGVNVVVNNGVSAGQAVPHSYVDVIPRSDNDGIDFSWQGKKADDSMLNKLAEKIKGVLEKKEEPEAETKKDESEDDNFVEADDYFLKSLDRIP